MKVNGTTHVSEHGIAVLTTSMYGSTMQATCVAGSHC